MNCIFFYINKMRIAILLPGGLKTYHLHIQEFYNNLIKPNNADVFMYLNPNSDIKSRGDYSSVDIDHDALIRTTFKENLKGLTWCQNPPDTEAYQKWGKEKLERSWVKRYGKQNMDKQEHYNDNYFLKVVDQYIRLRECYRMLKEYSKEHNITYDIVIRFRVDIYIDRVVDLSIYDCPNGRVYIHTSKKFELRDYLFIANQKTMEKICEEFPDHYLSQQFDPIHLERAESITYLSPECQLGQYLQRNLAFDLYQTPLAVEQQNINGALTLVLISISENISRIKRDIDIDRLQQHSLENSLSNKVRPSLENSIKFLGIYFIVLYVFFHLLYYKYILSKYRKSDQSEIFINSKKIN
jgi:hypothetical protein